MSHLDRRALGQWGEAQAAVYLAGCGYSILDRNARTHYGELDLVASQDTPEGRQIVFVEVKTRSSNRFGFPEESVTPQKQAHLLAAAQEYLLLHPDLEGAWRVDVIAIQRLPSHPAPVIRHFENAIRT